MRLQLEKETVDSMYGQWYEVVADRSNCHNMETKGRLTRAMETPEYQKRKSEDRWNVCLKATDR